MQIKQAAFGIGLIFLECSVYSQSLAGSQPPIRRIAVDKPQDSLGGSCSFPGQCNLRAALTEAQSQNQDTIIALTVDVSITEGDIALVPENAGALIRIEGEHGAKSIIGNDTSRLVVIDAKAHVAFSHVSIAHFRSTNGGAILNHGVLELTDTVFQNNQASCFETGAMTAFASCSGGAIANFGTLILQNGSRFDSNEAVADASTASFTTASAHGGAISSSGTMVIEGAVHFANNNARSLATSGIHPMPAGGATASSFGGAIANFKGSLRVAAAGSGVFVQNKAIATARTHYGQAEKISRGGALFSSGGPLGLAPTQFIFQDNEAGEDPDLSLAPVNE